MTGPEKAEMESAYLALGRLIAASCPVGFATASLHAEVREDETRLSITAVQPDGTEVHLRPGGDATDNLIESLRGIRDAMAGEDGGVWRNCVVTLRAGGHFAIEVEY
jgi:hypothetical protein